MLRVALVLCALAACRAQQAPGLYCNGAIRSLTCSTDGNGYVTALSFGGGDGWYFKPAGGSRIAFLGIPSSDTKSLYVPDSSAGIVKVWVGSDRAGTRVSGLQLVLDGVDAPWTCGGAVSEVWKFYVGASDHSGMYVRTGGRMLPVLCGVGGAVNAQALASLTTFAFAAKLYAAPPAPPSPPPPPPSPPPPPHPPRPPPPPPRPPPPPSPPPPPPRSAPPPPRPAPPPATSLTCRKALDVAGFVRLYAAGALVTLGDYLDDVSNSPASLSDDELEAHAREQQQQQQQARPPPPPPPPGAGGGGDGWREETRDDEYVYQDADGYYFDWNTLEWKWAKPGEAPKGGGAAHVAAAGLGPGPELPLPPPPPRPPRRARGRPRGRPLSAPGVSAASLVEPRAAAAARAAARAGAWTNANGFKAGDASTRGAAASPPLDASAAFGAGKLLVAANSFINVFDLSNGGAELKRTVPFSKFFSLIPERTHDVVRSPAVAFDRGFDRGDGRWLLAATSHDSRFVDNGIGGRVLLGASMTSDPKGIWRVIGITLAPLCDVPQYAEPDMLSLSYSKTGIYFSLVLRCHDPTSGAVKSEPRILAVDKKAFYQSALGNLAVVPYWAPPADKAAQVMPARPQHDRDQSYGGDTGAALFVGQRVNPGTKTTLLSIFALVNTATLDGLTSQSSDKPRLCDAAVDLGPPPAGSEACGAGGAAVAQPGGAPPLLGGQAGVTYGAALTYNPPDGRWHVHAVTRHTNGGGAACRPGVSWARVAVPGAGELAGMASLSASDYIWSDELALAFPAVSVSKSGVAWVTYVIWGPKQSPGAGFSRIINGKTFEPFVNVAKTGFGQLQGSYKDAWATYTSSDVTDEMLFAALPYAAPASDRPFAAWVIKIDNATMAAAEASAAAAARAAAIARGEILEAAGVARAAPRAPGAAAAAPPLPKALPRRAGAGEGAGAGPIKRAGSAPAGIVGVAAQLPRPRAR